MYQLEFRTYSVVQPLVTKFKITKMETVYMYVYYDTRVCY